ncbi:MAG: hypothetical protein MI725_01450, partial [Pirellulales bacterium]|nr:hypothetical protein [Pirellulales bacterium]
MSDTLVEVQVGRKKATQLLQLVAGLGVRYGYERSFRFSHDGLHANRFLITLSKGSIERKFRDARSDAHHAEDAILSICQTLNMPGPTLVPVAQIL